MSLYKFWLEQKKPCQSGWKLLCKLSKVLTYVRHWIANGT
jgi:hypothetical protein